MVRPRIKNKKPIFYKDSLLMPNNIKLNLKQT